jgi:opacity protein-like surface antigen
LIAGCALFFVLPRAAAAAGFEEWQAGVVAGVAAPSADGRRPVGPLLGLDAQYGVTDAWALRAAADLTLAPVSADATGRPGGLVRATRLTAGVTYAVDVLRVVPILEAGVAFLDVAGDVRQSHQALGFQLGVGAEYFLSRRWAAAVVVRGSYLPLRLGGGGLDEEASVFALLARLSRIWGP